MHAMESRPWPIHTMLIVAYLYLTLILLSKILWLYFYSWNHPLFLELSQHSRRLAFFRFSAVLHACYVASGPCALRKSAQGRLVGTRSLVTARLQIATPCLFQWHREDAVLASRNIMAMHLNVCECKPRAYKPCCGRIDPPNICMVSSNKICIPYNGANDGCFTLSHLPC